MRTPLTSAKGSSITTPTTTTTTTSKTTPCCSKVGLKRGPWTPEEDQLLSNYINKEGEGRWRTLPKRAGLLRCGKSCRLRWMNYLRPSVKRGQIAPDEEDLILRLHRLLGNRWSLIAGRIPGRTDNEIKNYWNTHLSKKLISQGIDPRTHKPLINGTNQSAGDHVHQNKASSSKRKASPESNNPAGNNSSGQEETSSENTAHQIISTDKNNKGTISYFQNNAPIADDDRCILIRNAAGCGGGGHGNYMGLLNSGDHGPYEIDKVMITNKIDGLRGLSNEGDNEDDQMNYCSDDILSSFLDTSFLNSFINEEAFTNQQNHHQLQFTNGAINPPISHDSFVSNIAGSTTFGLGSGWESAAALIPSSGFNQNDPKRVNNEDKLE